MRALNLDLTSADAEYKRLRDKQFELNGQRERLKEEERQIHARMAQRARERKSGDSGELDPEIAEMLGEEVGASGPDKTADGARLHEIRQQVSKIERAQEHLRPKLNHQRVIASRKVCERVSPEYSRTVEQLAKSLIEAGKAYASYLDLVSNLNGSDVAWTSLGPAHFRALGDPRDPESPLRHWLADQIRAGHISEKIIPKEWTR